ncbi:hypothetical protein ACF0H5_015463 [Mactra antiquata]
MAGNVDLDKINQLVSKFDDNNLLLRSDTCRNWNNIGWSLIYKNEMQCGRFIYVLLLLLPPIIFQGTCVFSPRWFNDSKCSTNQTSTCSVSGLDDSAFKLNEGAFWIMLAPVISVLVEICILLSEKYGCYSSDKYETGKINLHTLIGGFCFMIYPLAGLLSFVGCMIIIGNHSGLTLATSFQFCTASSVYVTIMSILLLIWAMIQNREKFEDLPVNYCFCMMKFNVIIALFYHQYEENTA